MDANVKVSCKAVREKSKANNFPSARKTLREQLSIVKNAKKRKKNNKDQEHLKEKL